MTFNLFLVWLNFTNLKLILFVLFDWFDLYMSLSVHSSNLHMSHCVHTSNFKLILILLSDWFDLHMSHCVHSSNLKLILIFLLFFIRLILPEYVSLCAFARAAAKIQFMKCPFHETLLGGRFFLSKIFFHEMKFGKTFNLLLNLM